ncbi:folylpolyglutamate synthase/dihydrofolate synthase family protein [Candidatus Merdisoma sp. JLR.KK006]|uniref:bifunctional folylpolyglutamate synthase/dihydrofolate synthase n=1 Tax=Candidatus Merdisoma sp. JLR.KK006 TaxID=3112626 RepID=UPI002FEF8EBB
MDRKTAYGKMTYEEAAAYIEETPKFTKKNTLENTKAILHRLGNPQEQMKILHVAGTNGKGSVCSFLASMLHEAGKHTGLFISPHLVDVNERFVIDEEQVNDEQFLEAFRMVMSCVEQMEKEGFAHPTYFELLFLIGMMLFKMAEVEYLVLETGLGGRLDATNSIAHPLVTVITSISLDHTEYLGNTVEAIAGEKAGIIKEGVPVVYDAENPEAGTVIQRRAEELRSPAFGINKKMLKISSMSNKNIDFSINSGYYDYIELSISSVAEYQVKNAALAVTALKAMELEGGFTDEVIKRGIAHMRWQGRMETVLPHVIIDGAHNEAGVEEFVKTAKRLEENYPVTLLFAAVGDKDYRHMIEKICQELPVEQVIVTEVGGCRCVNAGETAALFKEFGTAKVLACPNVEEAFSAALKEKGDGILFCVGSLYLVGSIKRILRRTAHD